MDFLFRLLINLDSSGGGGREIVFQTGPNHPWLIKVRLTLLNILIFYN